MKYLILIFLFIQSAHAINEACKLEKFQIREASALPAALNEAKTELKKIANAFHSNSSVTQEDILVINDPDNAEWFDRFEKFQKLALKASGSYSNNIDYAGLDDQGLMITVNTKFQDKVVKLSLSSKKLKNKDDLRDVNAELIAVSVGEKNYATLNDLYLSQLSENCLQGMTVKKAKSPLFPTEIVSFENHELCEL